ncbi:MAG: tRNA (adenosine(37)-N6)-threonylcarbamoyltransferase complex ATPase subunit type 1 TsaE [Eubacteriaceae bacterium]|nr:tRNA (adenosine(37)-N6)-threonylcarbamoyltransferase complex ATPase subunit type 1 TsaE [Eubacteriaceae bacterium]
MVSITMKTKSSGETFDIAKRLGQALTFPLVIFLHGGMGMGKTIFSKGFVEGLGLEDEVTSPTYTIVNEYGDPPRVFHFDLYRLCDKNDLYEMGFEDYLNQGATLLLEWPDLAFDYDLEPKLEITLKSNLDFPDEREIVLETTHPEIMRLLKKI